jgi:hypothetical protein
MLHPNLGSAGRGSALAINGFIYFFSGNTVYRTDGTTFEDLGLPIKDKFNFAWDTPTTTRQCDAVFWDNKYILRIPNSATTLYVYDIYADAWSIWVLGGAAAVNGFARYQEAATDVYYSCNQNTGKIQRMGDEWYEDGSNALTAGTGTAITATAWTKNLDFGSPATWKRHHYTELILGGMTGAAASEVVDLDYVKDTNATVNNATKTFTNADGSSLVNKVSAIQRFPGAGRCRSLQHRLTTVGANPLTIYGMLAQMEIKDIVPLNR